eukprot:CAMPEP_0206593010 /NCGR_PEP_ID=MMETSP0325_2-20121206/41356_1 /ASSEMBLY_ACC=CAM_ASM_000347 /TAXON_ID=2866 /ORGANISM="Crypthecodinium cohnii, Strain Seligo" /LENGTH=97 /DNA_ID=CAMNT_0054102863 /DNA_START=198 /DNA_END=488 /DNA_ORIENTATION=+
MSPSPNTSQESSSDKAGWTIASSSEFNCPSTPLASKAVLLPKGSEAANSAAVGATNQNCDGLRRCREFKDVPSGDWNVIRTEIKRQLDKISQADSVF